MAALKDRKTLAERKSFLWPLTVKVERESTWRMWDKVVPPPGCSQVVTGPGQGRGDASPLCS